MEFNETPRFWYPRVARDDWINFNTRTVEFRQLERLKKFLFFFLLFSPSSFLPLLSGFLSFSHVCIPSFSFFFLSISPFLIHQTSLLFFAPISFSHFLISHFSLISLICSILSFSPFTSLFLILIHRIFLFFFPLFHFLFYLIFFLFYFLFLIWIASTECFKSGGNFPPLSSIATCHHHHFSVNFLIFLFPLFPLFDTWLNVSHSHKCTTWLMPCVTHLGCHVAST